MDHYPTHKTVDAVRFYDLSPDRIEYPIACAQRDPKSVFVKFPETILNDQDMYSWVREQGMRVTWYRRFRVELNEYEYPKREVGVVAEFESLDQAALFKLYWA